MLSPDWVPARTETVRSPSRVSTSKEAPSAAAVMGTRSSVNRSSPSRCKVGCSTSWTTTYRSPLGPPATPASPRPDRRMRVPSATPAGTSTSMSLRTCSRPSPSQSLQGVTITVPNPRQAGHGALVMTLPRKERWTRWMEPWPLHWEQVTGSVPGAQQEPSQVAHVT